MKLSSKCFNKLFKLYILLFLLGNILALLYYLNLNSNDINNIKNNIINNHTFNNIFNNSIDHLKILSIITLFSCVLIGFPLIIGLIISEGFIFLIRCLIMAKIYKFKGFIYGSIHYFINNGLFLIFIYFLFKKIYKIFKKLYNHKIKKESLNYIDIYKLMVSSLYIIIIIFILDILVYTFGSKLLKVFAILLK